MPSIAPSIAQVGMTLAALAYYPSGDAAKQKTDLTSALAHASLPTNNQWQLVWGPTTVDNNLAYIVQGPDNQYAYVLRGTVPKDWSNLWEDADVQDLQALPWTENGFPKEAQLSGGAVEGFTQLTSAENDGWGQYLSRNLPSGATLYVVGHSLGGMLASVMGAYFYCQAQQPSAPDITVRLLTFAGQTAGNQSFATAVDAHLDGTGRYYNTFDVIPKAFNHNDLESIKKLFPGGPDYPSLEAYLVFEPVLKAAGNKYFQPPKGTPLTSGIYKESGWNLEIVYFFEELLKQHNTQLYMYLLGIKLDVVQQLPGGTSDWAPPPSLS